MIYKGYEIEILQDDSPENPRDWDNLGTMYCEHSRYNLGDLGADKPDGAIISLPLYLYDHSGITMNTTGFSCGWDSGQVGIIYVTRAKLEAEGLQDRTEAEILIYLENEVKTYDQYLTGQVYGYDIPLLEDSCWGFYGNDHENNGLLERVHNTIDYHVKRDQTAKHRRIKTYIKHNVPLIYRIGR